MPQQFVKIVNRDSYTNPKKAEFYLKRGLAKATAFSISGQPTEIAMLDAAELAFVRAAIRSSRGEYDPVTGNFHMFVGESGGSRLMQQYQDVQGGYRLWQFDHGCPDSDENTWAAS